MAEARVEDEEERIRESRGGGGGRNPRLARSSSSERAERNKPEQRLSQGALSSIRAAIKRTSNRTTVQPDHYRDRRRPEITILSAEPLPTSNWFPGSSGAIPPPPPPVQPSWASSGLTVHLPPPSYEQVIKEKSQEQNVHPSSGSASSSSTSSCPAPRRSTVTISTQTDTESSVPQNRTGPRARRPPKPPRPTLPLVPKPAESLTAQTLIELNESNVGTTNNECTSTHGSEDLSKPLSEQCGDQTNSTNIPDDPAPVETSDLTDTSQNPPLQLDKQEVAAPPRPRPRSKAILQPVTRQEIFKQPMTREVKVQTLVRLKDDGSESIFAGFTESSLDVSSNKYMQELMDVFGFEEQDFQSDQPSESDQSEESEREEEEETVALESCAASNAPLEPFTVSSTVPVQSETLEPLERPEPRPRTRSPKPAIAPKPSELLQDVKETENSSEEKNKQPLNCPVPAPRPLLANKSSEGIKPENNNPTRPPVAARRSLVPTLAEGASAELKTPTESPKPSVDDQNVNELAKNSSSACSQPSPGTSASTGSGKCPLVPTQTQPPTKPSSQRRPPRPSITNSQVAVGGVRKPAASSVPSLPPRPSEGKLLPLRPPPPNKLAKSGGSAHTPATANQRPSHRVPKRAPPLPPRPKPGHPLYKDYTNKVPQGSKKMSPVATEAEEHNLQEEELLLVLDDTHTPTRTPSPPGEVKDQVGDGDDWVYNDVCEVLGDEPVTQQKQKQEVKKESQIHPITDVRCVAQFAFEGQKDELSFHEGDVITLTGYVNEEWGQGSIDGQTGVSPFCFVNKVPSSQKKPTLESSAPAGCEAEKQTGRALYDFHPDSEDELCLKVGDVVCSLEEVDEEWFVGEFGGKRGIVPKNYIQVL